MKSAPTSLHTPAGRVSVVQCSLGIMTNNAENAFVCTDNTRGPRMRHQRLCEDQTSHVLRAGSDPVTAGK